MNSRIVPFRVCSHPIREVQFGAGVFYKPRAWAELGLEYRYERRDSNVTAADMPGIANPRDLVEYTNNVFMFTFQARL